ncbi:protein phosphatase 2C domain-containing protein [Streptomyces sp. NPDC088762]|uniref:protein phosphatase 2C domain-containing protein n=1 Tax=Streptomyces sp. NPDC088762 TaxID=3365891 RepID=UPI0037FA5E31
MSQQGAGADDWWQKLYEDPDAGPEPDPGDTLDNRFRSASGLTADPAAGPPEPPVPPPPPLPPEPPQATLPSPRPEPPSSPPLPPEPPVARDSAPPAREPLPDAGRPESAPPLPASPPPPTPPPPPGADAGRSESAPPLPPPPPPARPAEAGPGAPAHGLVPGPRSAPGPGGPVGPSPRDPRAGGATGYALGNVDVPPAEPAGLPARRWEAPPEEDPTRELSEPPPGPVPQPAAPERRPEVSHLGDRAPTYAAEPGALPAADPAAFDGSTGLTHDTVLEGARYGTYTLRAASVRGDSARFRGEARRDFLLTARFGGGDGALVLVALAGGDRAAPGAAAAAAELCHTVAAAVGRSQERLADDILSGHRDALRSGLQRLTDRGYGRLRARAAELGLAEEAYTAGLRGLLLPVDPRCRTRVSFGAGAGGLFRLRGGRWEDLEPAGPPAPPEAADAPAGSGFRFRASVARPGDTLLLCSGGLADPMREEGLLPAELAARWAQAEPPGLAAFLADTQLRLKGYADDRTAAAVWEA